MPTVSPLVGLCAAVVLLSSWGCLSQSYEVSVAELERLTELPAEERGERVQVTQQTSLGSDVSDVEAARLSSDVDVLLLLTDDDRGSRHERRRRRRSDDAPVEVDDDGDDDAAAALATAVVVVAAAAAAAVTVGITEGARFDGWMQVPEEHPVLLVGEGGVRQWRRLETLTHADLRSVDHAVFPDFAGDLRRLERRPLDRAGFVYQLEFGAEPAPVEISSLAVSGRGGLGFMPDQRYGFLLGAAFSTARGNEGSAGESSTLSFDHRVFLQAEAWPVSAGRWHLGPYVELGYAWALADAPIGSRAAEGPMLALGAALQVECTTRLALTLRGGAAWLPSIDPGSALASGGYRLSPGVTLGLGIY
jgi:hypothetical protein